MSASLSCIFVQLKLAIHRKSIESPPQIRYTILDFLKNLPAFPDLREKRAGVRAGDAPDLITEVNRTLPLYKRMTAVEFTAEPLPRNAAGKLLRT